MYESNLFDVLNRLNIDRKKMGKSSINITSQEYIDRMFIDKTDQIFYNV